MSVEDKGREFEKTGEGILEYYFRSYLDYVIPEIKKMAVSQTPSVDSDLVLTAIDLSVESIKKEFCFKINVFLMIVMRKIAQGDFADLRKFETIFIDLIRRTLSE